MIQEETSIAGTCFFSMDYMFSDVSPDGKDEQRHDVSTHLPGPFGTILKVVKTFNHDEAAKEEKHHSSSVEGW